MNPSDRLVPPEKGVAIRLYRPGIGDSFLLAFPRSRSLGSVDPDPFYLLIDCGAVLGTPHAESLMHAVASDIAAATGGRIDLLVITHEHWDHVSGFLQAEHIWKSSIHIETVWMAWTENPNFNLARRLKKEFQNDLEALRLALDRSGEDAWYYPALAGLLGLFGDPVEFMAAVKAGRRFSHMTHDALEKVRELASNRVEYREPGEVLTFTDVPGIRFYVLGPPQDEQMLRNHRPTKRRPQTYNGTGRPENLVSRPTERSAFTLALRRRAPGELAQFSDEDNELYKLCFPFESHLRIPLAEAAGIRFFQEYYGFAEGASATVNVPIYATASREAPATLPPHGPRWRRITVDWLEATVQFAAKRRTTRKSPHTTAAEPPRQVESHLAQEHALPFDRHLGIGFDEAAQLPFFVEYHGFDKFEPVVPQVQSATAEEEPEPPVVGPEWRRIDADWLGIAGELALQMDGYTNNTSLALAIELVSSGRVLLFPADAQIGNWLSWHAINPPFAVGNGRCMTAADLLRKTVFYKVGHHGSHNGTLRDEGLERMVSPDLIAFVPVDERLAHDIRHWRNMPFGPLLARLYEKTDGRVIRLDHGVVREERPEFLPVELWTRLAPKARAFEQETVKSGGCLPGEVDQPLYYQLIIEDAPSTPTFLSRRA